MVRTSVSRFRYFNEYGNRSGDSGEAKASSTLDPTKVNYIIYADRDVIRYLTAREVQTPHTSSEEPELRTTRKKKGEGPDNTKNGKSEKKKK